MITLYGMGSPNVVKVLIALEELGLTYDFVPVDVMRGDQFGEGFGRLTPNRKVPVIIDEAGPREAGGEPFILWESGAILIYLAEREGQLLPAAPSARYATLQWLMFQMASIGPMGGQLSHFIFYAPGEEHAYSRARYATEVKRIYDVVETRLRRSEWLGGAEYSIADIAAWPWLKEVGRRGIDLAGLPAVRRWIDAIAARPAIAKAQAVLDAMDTSEMMRAMQKCGDPIDRYLGRGKWSRPELV